MTISIASLAAVSLVLGLASAPEAQPDTKPAPKAAAKSEPAGAKAADADEVLAELDRRAAAFDDQSYTATMAIAKGGEVRKTLTFQAKMKGLDRQLIVFEQPGDVAGMKVLMEDAETLYLYLPEFKKVRRVAAHVRSQGFLGSEFSYEDMTQVRLAPFFKAAFGPKEGNLTTLVLTPKPGVESSFSKVEVVIDATKGGVTKLRYFDSQGVQAREQVRLDWIRLGKQMVPTRISMKNLKTGDVTTVVRSDIRVNQGLPDSVFSRRELLRG